MYMYDFFNSLDLLQQVPNINEEVTIYILVFVKKMN